MRFVLLVVAAMAVSEVLHSTSVRADTPTAAATEQDNARRKEAEQHFDRGLELVQSEHWDAALAEFRRSRELYPTRVALKNAAICLRQLQRYTEAIDTYQELLRLFGATMQAEDRKGVEEALAVLRRNVGEIVIGSEPAGAVVVVDGKELGTTPLQAPLAVNAGTRTVRLYKEGYVAFEVQVMVAGNERKGVQARLHALARSGRLTVKEAKGEQLDVVVDGVVVGRTPWVGQVAVGTHTLLLRSESDRGTAPITVEVVEGKTASFALVADRLDAVLRVEPTPANAAVHIDGVQVGVGIWEGRLRSGSHRIEVVGEGFFAFRRDVQVASEGGSVVKAVLERDLSNALWREAFKPNLYVEVLSGGVLGPGLGGSTAAACGRDECSEHRPLLGFVAGARGGLQIAPRLGVELFAGYLGLSERATRTVQAEADVPVNSRDYQDRTSLSGALAAASVSYRMLDRTPLTARLWVGALRAYAKYSNEGTYTGRMPATTQDFQARLSVPEVDSALWIPMLGPEIRFGYKLSKGLVLDFGVAFWLFVPPGKERTGQTARDRNRGERSGVLPDVVLGDGTVAQPGTARLPRETGLGTFYAVVPTLGARFDL